MRAFEIGDAIPHERALPARPALLACGIASSLLYAVVLVVAPTMWRDYSSVSQTVSELFGIGAPSRPFVVATFLVYDVLVMAFGLGVFGSAGGKRALKIVGSSFVAYGAIGLVAAPFAPIHLRGEPASFTDVLHAALTMLLVLIMAAAIGFGAAALQGRFRWYSIATIVVLVVFGALAGLDGPNLARNLPTPWLGITERVNIGAFLVWVAALAITLRRALRRGDIP